MSVTTTIQCPDFTQSSTSNLVASWLTGPLILDPNGQLIGSFTKTDQSGNTETVEYDLTAQRE